MKIVLIGHGMVGHKFLESLAETGLSGAEVTVLCEEPRAAYDRVHLSEFFSGKSADELSLVEPGFFERTGFSLRLATRAAAIDRRIRTVTTVDGEVIPYDKLVLATGSNPFIPQVPGRDRAHCFVYRTIEDLEAMKASGAKSRSGVVVGGGLLGLGLLVSELVKQAQLQAKPEQVRARIEEFAENYEQPAQVVSYYLADRQRRAEIEAIVLEDNVVAHVLEKAKVTDEKVPFDQLMGMA